jgi:hypothetical protein
MPRSLPPGVTNLDLAIHLAPKASENVTDAVRSMAYQNPDWRKVWLAVLMEDLKVLGAALDSHDDDSAEAAITQVAASAIAFVSELDLRTGRAPDTGEGQRSG